MPGGIFLSALFDKIKTLNLENLSFFSSSDFQTHLLVYLKRVQKGYVVRKLCDLICAKVKLHHGRPGADIFKEISNTHTLFCREGEETSLVRRQVQTLILPVTDFKTFNYCSDWVKYSK